MKSDDAITTFKIKFHLNEIKSPSIIVLLNLPGNAFEFCGGAVKFSGDFDPKFWMSEDGVVINRDPAINRDDFPVFRQDNGVDLGCTGIIFLGYLVKPSEK